MNYSVKSLTMGAMCIALNLVAVLLDRMLGGLSELLLLLLLALPICLYTLFYSSKEGVGVYFANAIACLFFATPTMFIYALIANLLGLWYGYGIHKQFQHGTLFGVNVVIMGLCYFLTTIIFATFFGYDLEMELEWIAQTLQSLQFSLSASQLMSLYVYATLWMSVLQSVALHFVVFILLKRFKIAHRPMQSIMDWRLSKRIAFVFIVVLVVYLTGNMLQWEYVNHPIILLSYLSVLLVGSLFGAVVCLVLIPMRSKRLLVFLLMIALFVPFLREILMFIGLVDAWYDFRWKFLEKVLR